MKEERRFFMCMLSGYVSLNGCESVVFLSHLADLAFVNQNDLFINGCIILSSFCFLGG